MMMPRLQNHLGVISKRMIWKALTKFCQQQAKNVEDKEEDEE
jgi:hypothetical protein